MVLPRKVIKVKISENPKKKTSIYDIYYEDDKSLIENILLIDVIVNRTRGLI